MFGKALLCLPEHFISLLMKHSIRFSESLRRYSTIRIFYLENRDKMFQKATIMPPWTFYLDFKVKYYWISQDKFQDIFYCSGKKLKNVIGDVIEASTNIFKVFSLYDFRNLRGVTETRNQKPLVLIEYFVVSNLNTFLSILWFVVFRGWFLVFGGWFWFFWGVV